MRARSRGGPDQVRFRGANYTINSCIAIIITVIINVLYHIIVAINTTVNSFIIIIVATRGGPDQGRVRLLVVVHRAMHNVLQCSIVSYRIV